MTGRMAKGYDTNSNASGSSSSSSGGHIVGNMKRLDSDDDLKKSDGGGSDKGEVESVHSHHHPHHVPPDGSDEPKHVRRARIRSLYIVHAGMFVFMLGYSIILTGVYPYMRQACSTMRARMCGFLANTTTTFILKMVFFPYIVQVQYYYNVVHI